MENPTIGQSVIWRSAKGYTPPGGERGTVDHVWPELRKARLTLAAPDAPPEFGGKCPIQESWRPWPRSGDNAALARRY